LGVSGREEVNNPSYLAGANVTLAFEPATHGVEILATVCHVPSMNQKLGNVNSVSPGIFPGIR
jgi:hypothetical protein